MLCPCCKKELIRGEDLPLQTLTEHVCSPNETPCLKASFRCGNRFCAASHPDVLWNEDGEIYGYVKGIQWIDNNDAPFSSVQRQCNIEICKHDEDRVLFTIPFWPLRNWALRKVFSYRSNENGDILSRKSKMEWFRWRA